MRTEMKNREVCTLAALITSTTFALAACATPQNEPEHDEPAEAFVASITLSGNVKTRYLSGSSFDRTGLIVTANYSDGTSEIVDDYEVAPASELHCRIIKLPCRSAGSRLRVE